MERLVIIRMDKNRARQRCLAALTGLILAGASVQAGADRIYRWVDENGVVNYTQQKPRDAEAQSITTKSGSPRVVAEAAPVPTAPETGQPLNAEQERMLKGLRAAEQVRQDEIAKLKEENCQKSRNVLSRLTLKNRIRIRDDTGEYRVLPEDERQERIASAQEGIARYCVS